MIIGPYCPFPREVWDDTCTHPPGSAAVVTELRREHKLRLFPDEAARAASKIAPDEKTSGELVRGTDSLPRSEFEAFVKPTREESACKHEPGTRQTSGSVPVSLKTRSHSDGALHDCRHGRYVQCL